MKANTALTGVLLITGSNLAVKVLGIISQILIVTLVSKEDFALFGLATSIAAFALGFRNGGSDNLLIQKGKYTTHFSSIVLSYSLIFNSLAFAILTAIGFFSAEKYHEPSLTILLALNGVGLLAGTLQPILTSKLALDSRFKAIALINLASLTVKHLTTIVFAWAGFGVYAFVVPIIFQYLSASYLAYKAHNSLPKIRRIRKKSFKYLINSTKWILGGNFCFQLSNNSQLIIIGAFSTPHYLSLFFFCVILVNSPIALINGAINDVIFPKLSLFKNDLARYRDSIIRAINLGFSLNFLVTLVSSIIFPILITTLWNTKWNDAIPILKIMIFTIPTVTLAELASYVLASTGRWRYRFTILAIFVFLELSFLTASITHLTIIQTCILFVVFKAIIALVSVFVIYKMVGIPMKDFNRFLVRYFLPAVTFTAFWMFLELNECAALNNELKAPFFLLVTFYYLFLSRQIFTQVFRSLVKKINFRGDDK